MGAERAAELAAHEGLLIVIFGPMFSGKSGALIDEVERLSYIGMTSVIIKPANDIRYIADKVVTHSGKMIDAFRVNDNDPGQILALLAEIEGKDRKNKCINIVAIDEIQFFKPPNKVVEVVERLVDEGRVVIAAGLPTDFRDQVFGAMPELIAKADKAIQMTALCTHMENGVYCGKPATKSQRFVDGQPAKWDEPIEVVGGKEMYAARCREHYFLEKPQ